MPKDHLARFEVDIVDQLDLSALIRQYRGTGSAAYHPSVMLGLLVYGYATSVYSSRRIEAATYESIAFRYIASNEQPDHDSLCTFRKRFLREIEALFVQVLCIARQMKLLKLGRIALDGTKIHAMPRATVRSPTGMRRRSRRNCKRRSRNCWHVPKPPIKSRCLRA